MTMPRTHPITLGDRWVQRKEFQDLLVRKPRLAALVESCRLKDRQRELIERLKRK